ncbi:hypothetical protein CHS0354_020717 [Potamilus streckersoni]|uniref:Uncharacterized protein n=1 Tax=Potamilus streckersoni TaxID=2493646 RepID=A0AAE0VRR3_9BIVA|nr:hypothetical protein CHS0354_020717 [Potamilus streckersoni]
MGHSGYNCWSALIIMDWLEGMGGTTVGTTVGQPCSLSIGWKGWEGPQWVLLLVSLDRYGLAGREGRGHSGYYCWSALFIMGWLEESWKGCEGPQWVLLLVSLDHYGLAGWDVRGHSGYYFWSALIIMDWLEGRGGDTVGYYCWSALIIMDWLEGRGGATVGTTAYCG